MTEAVTSGPDLLRYLSLWRFNLASEKEVQADIEAVLAQAGFRFEREFKLSAKDRPDFWLPATGTAVEVKVRGARKPAALRQLTRYAEHDQVREIVLVTGQSMGLPPTIAGKPAFYASLGRAWL